nr:uncharacterized protein LOC113743037 isoform X1 [Coffea arabica]XP_027126900.1 uncharacterized protein LOC113743037 isoform X1 [Coffea arabica]
MAFRGRGRGGFRAAKQENFDLFLEIDELGTAESVKVDPSFAVWFSKFQRYWNSSPYYVEDESGGAKKSQRIEIEKLADRKSKKTSSKQPLSHFIRMEPDYVPAELAKDEKKEKHGIKRVRWNPEAVIFMWQTCRSWMSLKSLSRSIRFKKGPAGRCGEGSTVGNANRSRPHALTSPVHCKCHIKLIFGVDALKLKKLLQNIDFDDDEDDFNTGDDNDDEPEL